MALASQKNSGHRKISDNNQDASVARSNHMSRRLLLEFKTTENFKPSAHKGPNGKARLDSGLDFGLDTGLDSGLTFTDL